MQLRLSDIGESVCPEDLGILPPFLYARSPVGAGAAPRFSFFEDERLVQYLETVHLSHEAINRAGCAFLKDIVRVENVALLLDINGKQLAP